jgi:CheY-like chemotaxis protein
VHSTPQVGTLFRIRLFLPAARDAVAVQAPRIARIGYQGARRRVLVVDNEEVDRALLASVLEPLGFEIHQAASGDECLRLLRSIAPDAILMDLAMPGIDGWATIRAIRAQGLSSAPVAIVSGNAFDKDLDNDVGITPADFVLKPVRVHELLDWLGARLGLQWVEATPVSTAIAPAPASTASVDWVLPDADALRALDELVRLGYFRGIVQKLDRIEAAHPACAGFVGHVRELVRKFQLEAVSRILEKALHRSLAAGPRP